MSPTVLTIGPYRLGFFSSDAGEPPHVHVVSSDGEAKLWLTPVVAFARSRGYRPEELRRIRRIVVDHQGELLEAWHGFFGR